MGKGGTNEKRKEGKIGGRKGEVMIMILWFMFPFAGFVVYLFILLLLLYPDK